MSVVRAATKPYGPAQIDIQIEQGADFELPITIQELGEPLNLSSATISAAFSPQWSPGAAEIPLTILPDALTIGQFRVSYPSASSLALVLPFPPRKSRNPSVFALGGWVLTILRGGITTRYAEGTVYMDRTPWLT